MIRFTSNKAFNKSRKRLPLCRDENGNVLYPYDFVRIKIPMELKTSWCARIYWTALDGAFVDCHPAHKKLHNNPDSTRDFAGIYRYSNKEKGYLEEYRHVITKISYEEYVQWKNEQIAKEAAIENTIAKD